MAEQFFRNNLRLFIASHTLCYQYFLSFHFAGNLLSAGKQIVLCFSGLGGLTTFGVDTCSLL